MHRCSAAAWRLLLCMPAGLGLAVLPSPWRTLAETGSPPPPVQDLSGFPWAGVIAALVVMALLALAIRVPSSRRWIAGGLVLFLGLVIGSLIIVGGALSTMDTTGGIPLVAQIAAAVIALAGIATAVWIVRALRSRDR